MPELPEVEYGRTIAERFAVGRRIERVACAEDEIVFDGVTPAEVRGRLTGRTVAAARRHGKHLWLAFDRGPCLLLHFGMTGALRHPEMQAAQLSSDPEHPDATWPPRFAKLTLHFEDGGELAFVNKRRFGRIRLRDDPMREPPIAGLGFDPLDALPAESAFAEMLRPRRGTIKGALLDQRFAAGVGNWIADEVLYQARVAPTRTCDSLDASELRRIRAALGRIVQKAVDVDADKERFPRAWLFHRRWGKTRGARTAAGEAIEHIEVAGRTTAWVPSVQR